MVLLALSAAGCAVSRPVAVTTGLGVAAAAYADVHDAQGKLLGRLLLTPSAGGIRVQGTLQGLPPGTHALHLHAVGQCVPPFTSAGPHFNPENVPHGLSSPQGGHAGDLPNVIVGQNGQAVVDVTGRARLEGSTGILDADGAAVVLHAAADDNVTDPAGNAGARIACGVITR